MARVPTDYVCLALSPQGFICNRESKHDGDHVAFARAPGTETYEADRWKNETVDTLIQHGHREEGTR